MLRERQSPPEFILPDKATGGHLALADLIGHTRIGIVLVPVRSEAERVQEFLVNCAKRSGELRDRSVQILTICSPEVTLVLPADWTDVHILIDATGQTSKQYDGSNEHSSFYLIDKSGLIHVAQADIPTIDELLAIIDVMPMRQNELMDASMGA